VEAVRTSDHQIIPSENHSLDGMAKLIQSVVIEGAPVDNVAFLIKIAAYKQKAESNGDEASIACRVEF